MEKEKINLMVGEVGTEIQRIKRERQGPRSEGIGPEQTGPKKDAEIFLGKASQVFTPDEIFWRQDKKERIKKLAAEIKRISWLDENKIDARNKIIPGINRDLSAVAIRRILEEHRAIPETEDADRVMTELHEMWAEKWLEHLENKRYGKRKTETEKPAITKPAPEPRPAEAKVEPKKVEGKGEVELNENQKRLFESLIQKAKLDEVERKFPTDDSKIPADMQDSWKARKRSLDLARGYLKEISAKVSGSEVEIFRDDIMDQFLEEYRRRKKEREKTEMMEETELQEFKKGILDEMEEALHERFKKGATPMVNYFRNVFNVEFLLTKGSKIVFKNID